ncbi:hypothetical protein N789_09060 [Arenimonas oryziterrae DSM 21050 = YC6267]|uniref:Chemotaxis protein CheA n=1 Tax=Arenimonas oryziterrae DSM 21050 = YC6267 TaxID=1121015 RepID=A0A091ATA5_9GAMM|nr:Hpt domain-containing protein [Arenimonas oryziterrae]KFN43413.1 hypothetical protein N789_09060 [Arenimonas oryziterrae DSM 21050 = YC6267]
MRLHENIDFTTLTWVKPELDETLKQARDALQAYVEDGGDVGELRSCASLLHQVQGTLRMVELYGAAMVAEEMEQLSKALIDEKVENREDAYGVLMQGIVQLPDYLERLQSGHRDIPIVLLPVLNQLRAARGEKGLSESVLFSPDLSRPLPANAHGPAEPLPNDELRRRAETLRGLYQGALLRWLKDDNSTNTVRDLTDVCEQLVPITTAEPARRLFWVAAGTLDALGKNAFPVSTPLKQALAKVEREIKRLAEGGDAAFRTDPPIELTKSLLYFVAHEGSDEGRIGEIRQVFGLSGSGPSEAELAHARGSLTGHNRALLETVAGAIKEDLLRVKDSLDLHLRTPDAPASELNAQVEALDRVADTLGMLGLGVPRRVVQEQRTAIHDVTTGQRKNDESTLLDIAGALLYVEASLDDQVARLGQGEAEAESQAAGQAPAMPTNESRKLLEVLIKEAITNFAQARQCFVAFVETHWDHAQLTDVPRLLEEVSGALRILDIQAPSDYLTAVRRFTENELLRRHRVPNGQQMDRLADALASLEYYLEALRDRRPNRDQIIDVARQSLESLGYWPLPAEDAAAPIVEAAKPAPAPVVEAPKPAPVVEPVIEAAPVAADLVEAPAEAVIEAPAAVEPAPVPFTPPIEVIAPVAAISAVAAAAAAAIPAATAVTAASAAPHGLAPIPGFDGASSEEIDDEIREVFLEEFEEEIGNLDQLLPPWRASPNSGELLRPIRRVFHTLKGSGRLVGAKTLGEFSWKVESMLNRVLDNSRPASPAVVALIELAFTNLPLLRAALQGETVYADLEGIQAVADRLSAGEEATYQMSPLAAVAADIPVGGLADRPASEVEAPEAVAMSAEPVVEAIPEPEEVVELAEDGGSTAFAIDPVLFEILKPEVDGHLETIDAWLAACAARGPQPVTDPLLRSVHTMNGAFAMTEVSVITDVTAPLEGYIKRSLAHHKTPSAEGVSVIADTAAAIRQTIIALERPRQALPTFDDLAARAEALRDQLPDSLLPSVSPHADVEETGHFPSAVTLETPDISAIPEFQTAQFDAVQFDAPVIEDAAEAETPAADAVSFEEISFDDVAPEAPVETASLVEEAAAAEPLVVDAADDLPSFETIEFADTVEPSVDEPATSALEQAPATEMLSLEDFLAPAPDAAAPAFSFDEAAPEPEAASVEVAAFAADAPVAAEAAVPAGVEADDALAAMIAAYALEAPVVAAAPAAAEAASFEITDVEIEAAASETPAEAEADEGFEVEEIAFEDHVVTSDVQEPAQELAADAFATPDEIEAAAPVVEAPTAAVEDDNYGMSLEELEALTSPEADVAAVASAEPVVESAPEPVAEEITFDEAVVEETIADAPAAEEAMDVEEVFADDPEELAAAAVVPAPEPVVEVIRASRPTVPVADDPEDPETDLDTSDLDVELLDIFLEESNDILDHSDGLLANLREHTSDRELVTGLQRDLHTLKGGARMAGIFAVGDLGHAMESLLEAVAEGRQKLDDSGVVVLERGFDRLHGMVARIGERKAIALPAGLIAQVEALARGQSLAALAAESADGVDTGTVATPEAKAASSAPAAPAAPLKPLSAPLDALADEEELASVRAPQEQVRIRADLLDRLVNYAGEVAIYRARLEQQLGAFRSNLGELNQTTTRLREQLRRLDIETEAQISARYAREQDEKEQHFDPLELDRFTNQQQLSRGLAESANDLVNLQTVLDDLTRQYETLLLQQSRVSSDLQEGLMRTRMVPFDALVPRLRRVLRQAASDTGKQVQLKVDGASGEMDRNVLERMTAPLEHMLRNSMAHGLETPDERRKAKKAEEGIVRIAVQREGSEVVLKVSDDGRGLNKDAIRRKAIEKGLIAADAELSEEATYALILEGGFSTAETVTRLSGRGVGMDVVYSEIRQLGGTLGIHSTEGKGSEFIIRLPFTLAVTQAVFVKIGDTSFAVPIASVQGVGRISRAELDKQLATEHPVFSYAGEDYAIHDLGHLIGHAPAKAQESLQMPLLLARSGELRAAISIDQVLGSREIVVKPVGPQVNSVPGIFGATIMGDGRVVVILDVAPLVRRHSAIARDALPVTPVPVVAARRVPVVMVVDDSITMRKVTGRVLERHNMEVLTAKDGVDAVEKMAERVPDLVLLDIEMPRMDGYEVAQNMRSDPRLKDVPIIMITSRTGDKHRQRAMDIGVNRYLGKPYQEPELMRNVFEMLGLEPVNG